MMFEDRAIIAFSFVAGIFVGLWVCTVNSSLSLNRNWKFNQLPYLEQTLFFLEIVDSILDLRLN